MASDEESSQASDTEEEDEEEEEEEEIGLYGCADKLMFSACVPGNGRTRRSESGRGWFMGRVLNPQAKWVEEWNRVYLLVCAAGLLVDPLFFYAISMSENFICIFIDGWFAITVTALRCMTDALHVWNMWLQFKMAKLRRSSSSHYNNITGEYDDGGDKGDSEESQSLWQRSTSATTTTTTTRTTAPVRSKKGFFLNLFVILPIPQVVLWVAIPSLLHKGSTTFVMTVMLISFLFQYLPKIWHFVRLFRRMNYLSGYIFGTVWWSFALTLMAYFVAAHAAGACWYLLGIQRAAECLGEECSSSPGCGPRILACQEPIHYGTGMVIRDPLRLAWGENSQVRSNCIDSGNNFNYGAYAWAVQLITNNSRLETILFPLFWGLMTLSTFGNLVCSTEWLEVLFNIIVLSSGLLLVTMLIGNIKNFLSGMTSKKQEKQTNIRNIEWWMKKKRLPQEFRQRVRQYEQQRWVAMRGVDETEMIRNLPEGLRREIKYNLCLDLVKQVPLFQHMDELVLENICDRVKSLIFPKGETIIREGDPVQRMIFVVRGHLESSQVLRDGVKSCCMLGPGNFSGDELLSWCLRRPFVERLPPSSSTLVTLGTTEAFELEAEDVKYVTQHFRYTFANEKVRRSTRYYSPGWRTWGAVAIQLAWRRHRHRLTLLSLSFTRPRMPLSRCSSLGEDRMRLYTALLASPKPNQDDFSF